MLYGQHEFLLQQRLFQLKLLFVGLLTANGVVLGRLMHIATEQTFRSTTGKQKIVLMVSGVASLVGWIGAFMMAKLLF